MSERDILYAVGHIVTEYDIGLESFYLFKQDGVVTTWVNCSDVFFWGTADFEQVTAENIIELERACSDAQAAGDFNEVYGPELFCARVRKMRPQGAWYKGDADSKALRELFDACGPRRTPDILNPKEQD